MRFEDRAAVVTGGASGFGEAIAKRLAAEGASVLVADLDEAGGKRVVAEIEAAGGRACFARTDVSVSEDVAAMIALAQREYARLDVLVNNAGFSHRSQPLWELPEAEFDRVFAVNTKGVYLGCKHAIPLMRAQGGGAIVNTASIGAVRPRPGVTAYNATKGAVVTLTRGLAVEVAPFKIRVNAVNPVAAETGFVKHAVGLERFTDAMRAQLTAGIPLGRLAEPRDVASAVCFLASDDAAFLTGVCLDVDGGRSIA
jgi:3-oxoacyl-[acyl-carrier protein] reductase